MRQIKTERLIIRPIQVTDYDELQAILLDPVVVRYTRYRDIKTEETLKLSLTTTF